MKINELMLGDYIFYDFDNIGKVKSISNKGVITVEDLYNKEYKVFVSDINPIVITSTMLELNGFVRDEYVSDWIYRIGNSDNHFISVVIRKHSINVEIHKNYTEVYVKLNYIHELQHLLRLCGLNYLDDNWKVKQ